jgi:hypothetical protein
LRRVEVLGADGAQPGPRDEEASPPCRHARLPAFVSSIFGKKKQSVIDRAQALGLRGFEQAQCTADVGRLHVTETGSHMDGNVSIVTITTCS